VTRELSCPKRHLVDRHFEMRIRPGEERSLRKHIQSCATCSDHYARHLAVARLDPRAPEPRERLAVGLGLRRRRTRAVPMLAAGAACAMIMGIVALRNREPADNGYRSRGAGASRLFVYRVPPGRDPTIAEHLIARDDDLAFAYENGAERKYLLVFAVDEHRHVYWYHPAWIDEGTPPVALAISRAAGIHELPEAIGHSYDGTELMLYAVFTDQALSVRDVEERMSNHGLGEPVIGIPVEDQQRIKLGVTR
jgi:hypothetical protein